MTPRPTAVIVHLSGELRGTTRRLAGPTLRLGKAPEAEVHLPGERPGVLGEIHATLTATADGYVLRAHSPHRVWVNGQPAEEQQLASGDLIELGEDGPLIRFRLYPAGQIFKSMRQALADCYLSAKEGSRSLLGGAWLFLSGILRELFTEVAPRARALVVGIVVVLLAAVVALAVRARRLEERLEAETVQIEALQALLDSDDSHDITARQLEELQRQLEARIASTSERLDFLEERAGAAQRTVAEAARSVVFLQGSYGFRDARTHLPLRFAVGPDGSSMTDAHGNPSFSTAGSGPLVEAFFTGTGFVASDNGLVVTNRHVALPWEFDEEARQVTAQGLEPFQVRLIGYVSGVVDSFDLELVLASGRADLAVLQCSNVTGEIRSLALEPQPPSLGEPVIVLGFPTGIQAMMARANQDFLDRIAGERLDFWQIAQRLSAAHQIGPLATRGIVGQATDSSVVYDAETTSGGSGGPVLNLKGRVVAINSAVLREFSGSNLGVPARLATDLLARAAEVIDAPEVSP